MDCKDIIERIARFQKHYKELSHVMSDYNEKCGLAREKHDSLAQCLMKYKDLEPFETTSQYAVRLAADAIGKAGDYQNAAILRIERKVMPMLSSYKDVCKSLKRDVSKALAASSRVQSSKKLKQSFEEKAEANPKYRNAVPDAEKELANSIAACSQLMSSSMEQVTKFEHKRMADLKDCLKTFFKIEIAKHAKSLEILTTGYKFLHSIDEDSDLEVLKVALNLHHTDASNLNEEEYHSDNSDKQPEERYFDSGESLEEEEEDEGSDTETSASVPTRRPATAPSQRKQDPYEIKRYNVNSSRPQSQQSLKNSDSGSRGFISNKGSAHSLKPTNSSDFRLTEKRGNRPSLSLAEAALVTPPTAESTPKSVRRVTFKEVSEIRGHNGNITTFETRKQDGKSQRQFLQYRASGEKGWEQKRKESSTGRISKSFV